MFLHKTYEGLHEHIPRELLPRDYGGEGVSFDELEGRSVVGLCWLFFEGVLPQS